MPQIVDLLDEYRALAHGRLHVESLDPSESDRIEKEANDRYGVSSTPFRLGHPLTIREVPVYGMVGWRFLPDSQFVPYVALGAGATSFSEKSIVGGIEDPPAQSQSKFSGHFIAGVEWGRGKLRVGAEFMYTTVPNTIGVGNVSKIYGESDVGGMSVVGKIVLVP